MFLTRTCITGYKMRWEEGHKLHAVFFPFMQKYTNWKVPAISCCYNYEASLSQK